MKRARRIIPGILFLLLLTAVPLSSGGVSSGNVAAILSEVDGQVTVIRPSERGARLEGEPDMLLKPGDLVTTTADSSAEISFDDESVVTVEERSVIQVTGLSASRKTGRQVTLSFMAGRLWAVVKNALDGGHQLSIRTPSAVAAVKGTEFGIEMVAGASEIGVYDGEVRVSGLDSKGGETAAALVRSSEETSVAPKASPRPPKAFGRRWQDKRQRMTDVRGNAQTLRAMKQKGEIREWREMRRLMYQEGKGTLPHKERQQLDRFRKNRPDLWNKASGRMKQHLEKRKQWEKNRNKILRKPAPFGDPKRDLTPGPEKRKLLPPRNNRKR